MTKLNEIYKCEKCGNIVEVVHPGDGTLVCCGEPMKLMREGSTDGAAEKHVPDIKKWKRGYHIQVGDVRHPMEQKHYIEWIELLADGKSYKRFLTPEDAPEAFFDEVEAENVTARGYCNLHGLWKAESK